ncbi:MAG: hypothetical protein Kow0068_09410 [Marinilabiliales bacterium]
MPERTSKKSGQLPGTLVHIGKVKTKNVKITIINYNDEEFNQFKYSIEDFTQFKNSDKIYWINIDGLQNTEIIGNIGKQFNLHPLLLEDILNTNHRPKFEEYDDYCFITLKMLGINKKKEIK